jgi:hypothetical protein
MLSGGRALHRPLAGGQVVSEIGCPPGGMEKCVSRGAGDIESGRTVSSLEQPAAPRRTRLGDAPRLPAIGTADVHDQGRARNHPRIEPAIPTGLNHETTNPSFGDVGWTMHWFAAWLSRAHPINGLPVLVLRSRPVYCRALWTDRRLVVDANRRWSGAFAEATETPPTVSCGVAAGAAHHHRRGRAAYDANRQPAGADLAGRCERTDDASECGDGVQRGLVGRRA